MELLDAVNRVLVSAQVQPVASLSSPDRFTARANEIVEQVRIRVLEQGWDFNTDDDYPLSPTMGQFAVPADSLQVDVKPWNSAPKEISVREGKLYDKTNRTFDFTETEIKATVIWDIEFDDLPLPAQEYIVCCACVKFSVQVAVDPDTARQLRLDEGRAWLRLKQFDSQTSNASPFKREPLRTLSSRWPIIR